MVIMSAVTEHLYLTETQFRDELIPALQVWDRALDNLGVERLHWFIFGSVVVKDQVGDNPSITDTKALIRGARASHIFGPTSDIDIGLVTPDECVDFDPNEPPFTESVVADHPLSLTRFDQSWVRENAHTGSHKRTPRIGDFGKVVVLI